MNEAIRKIRDSAAMAFLYAICALSVGGVVLFWIAAIVFAIGGK